MSGSSATLAAELLELAAARGHAVDNARVVAGRLETALADGSVAPSATLEQMLEDLRAALAQAEDQRLGGKSAEAARLIVRAIVRELERRQEGSPGS